MDITINSGELSDVAATSCRIALRVQAPKIAAVLISATDEVRFKATDGNESVDIVAHAVVNDGGAAYVPAKMLSEISKALPNGSVRIVSGGDVVTISCQSSSFTVPVFDSEQFSGVLTVDGEFCDCEGAQLANAVSNALSLAAGARDSRETLRGVFLEYDGNKLTVAGTDSYAATVATVAAEHGRPFTTILPADFARSIGKIGGHVRVVANERSVSVQSDREIHSSRAVEGRYPNIMRVFVHEPKVKTSVDSYVLGQAVSRASIAAGDKKPVRIETVSGRLLVSVSTELGSFNEMMNVSTTGDMRAAFNVGLFKRVLATVEGTCDMEFIDSEKALFIVQGNVQTLIMPVREGAEQ